MGDVILTGLASNDPVPGNYLEVNFAQGEAGGDNSARSILIFANKTPSGTAVVDTTVYGPDTATPASTEQQITTLTGFGSEVHRSWRWASKLNNITAIYFICVAESAGANATGTLTIATTPTGAGTVRLEALEEVIEYSFATGDTVTAIAVGVCAQVNLRTHLPFTASNVAGVITFTAKNKGPRGNQLRFFAQIISNGSVATTVSPSVDTAFTGGTTADNITNALATVASKFYYHHVYAQADATNKALACTQLDTQALPVTGKRYRAFFGSVDTPANSNALAIACNTAVAELVASEANPLPALELAAIAAATYAFEELPDNFRTNFVGFGDTPDTQARWPVPAPRNDADHPTRAEILSMLNNGVTPIGVGAARRTFIVNRITTRSLTGAVNDYRIRAAHKVSVMHRFAADWLVKLKLQYGGFRLAPDPPKGKTLPGPKVLCPAMAKGAAKGLIDVYDGRTLIVDAATTKTDLQIAINASNKARLDCRIRLTPVDNFEQSATALDQL